MLRMLCALVFSSSALGSTIVCCNTRYTSVSIALINFRSTASQCDGEATSQVNDCSFLGATDYQHHSQTLLRRCHLSHAWLQIDNLIVNILEPAFTPSLLVTLGLSSLLGIFKIGQLGRAGINYKE